MSSFPSAENFCTRLSVLSVTHIFPSRSTRIPWANRYGVSPQDFTKVPSGLSTKNEGSDRRKTIICPSADVATCEAAPHVIPAGSCPQDDSTSHFLDSA